MAPDPPLIRFPDLRVDPLRGGVRVQNLAHATHIECSRDTLTLLDFFREPRTRRELAAAHSVDAEAIDELIRQAILVPAADLDLLRTGLLAEARPSLGRSCHLVDLWREARGGFAIIGVPSDRGAGGDPGARHGPTQIRSAFPVRLDREGSFPAEVLDHDFERRHRTAQLQLLDLGDVQHNPDDPFVLLGRRVTHVVGAALDAGQVPLVLGGDHSVTAPVLSAFVERHRRLGILHFDAHSDLYDLGPSAGLHHGNPFFGALARPEVVAMRQVGMRGLEGAEPGAKWVRDRRLSRVSGRRAREGPPEAILEGLSRDIPWYLSLDIDVLAPEVAPETGTPVVGGLSADRLIALVDAAVHTLDIVGMDVVEVAAGPRNRAARVGARCLAQRILAAAPHKPADAGWYGFSPG